MKISQRAQNIKPSATFKVAGKAKEMNRRGENVINLGVGEPDFPTPEKIKNAGIEAINNNHTRYTMNPGIPELREAIVNKLKNENGLDYTVDEIIVNCGAKHSIYNSLLAITDPGDEVIIPAPYWVSYPHMVNLAQGVPVVIDTTQESGFKITAEQLKAAITPKTGSIILCNPSNPTGGAYTAEELKAIAEVVKENNITVISDEIYEKLVFDDFKFASFGSVLPDLKDNTIVINGVSKAFAMTGWRVGYCAAPMDVIKSINKIQGHTTSHACSISQYAALEAMQGECPEVETMRIEFEKRRNYLQAEMNKIEGVSCNLPEGAFYLFPNISGLLELSPEIKTSEDIAMYLLETGKVATVPGSAFGAEGFIRLSYATSMEELKEAVRRINEAVDNLRK